MALPLIIGGVMAASAIAQYLSSEEGRKANEQEKQRLKELIANLKSPKFDPSTLTPQQYQVVGKYVPQAANFIAEVAPQTVKMDSGDARDARAAQREALSRLRSQAQGNDPLADAEMQDAINRGAVNNRGRLDAIKDDFSRRGQGGGSAEMLAQILGTQGTDSLIADNSRAAFIEAQKRKLQSLRDVGNLAGDIRQDEFNVERGNNDIINSFNQRTAVRQQDVANRGIDSANQGQMFNLTNSQRVADNNVSTGNDYQTNERNRLDKNQQTEYQNEVNKVGLQTGITNMARTDNTNNAKDRNSAISGISDAAATYGMYAYGKEPRSSGAASTTVDDVRNTNQFDEENADPLTRRYKTNRMNA